MDNLWGNIVGGADILWSMPAMGALLFGLVAGFVVGVLPGISGPSAAAILLPFAIGLGPAPSLILIASIYAGATFSGSVPAILLNVPGTGGAVATTLDGYPMARQGQAGLAIGIARMASVLGGVIGLVVVIAVMEPVSGLAIRVGPPELFLIAILGLIIISTVIGPNMIRGLMAGLLGMLLAAMSADPIAAQGRATFGRLELYDSTPLVPAIIGLFAFSEIFVLAGRRIAAESLAPRSSDAISGLRQRILRAVGLGDIAEVIDGIRLTIQRPVNVLQSSLIGVGMGAIPGVGSSIASFVAYGVAKNRSETPERFGHGDPDGIIASEACDNAVAGGTLIPTLSLGVPGNATTAVMLAALYLQGIQPGPRILVDYAFEAYAVMLSLIVASLLILPVGIILSGPMIKLVKVRLDLLLPIVLVVSSLGAFAVRYSSFDIGVALAFGLLGFYMRRNNYPTIPVLIGLILGPLAEGALIRSLMLGRNDLGIFGQSTMSRVLLVSILALVVARIAKARPWARADRRAGRSV